MDSSHFTIFISIFLICFIVFSLIKSWQLSVAKKKLKEFDKYTDKIEAIDDINDYRVNAENELLALKKRAEETLKNADAKVFEASKIIADAYAKRESIIEQAEKQATEIAGEAYALKGQTEAFEKAIQAMKNTINGYKDDYIIPNHSTLDELADEFDFKEAGSQLKMARKTTRDMVKQGYAGDCDYVENIRRTYAIHFCVDAFNGKVDTAMAKVKHDNYGKIKQEIIDAFALVNHNGKPFRNARIRQEYLDARLDELKWAVAAFELRKIEKEEQAEIKAQMREEERAIREMEKARKEAEKEERMLQKALEKARKELLSANEEQKVEYEAQLKQLEGKLAEAEAKGERALSMAQQTRRGHVYIISNMGSFGEDVFKIGMTRRLEPMDRVKELGDASVPFSFDVHAMIHSNDAPELEKILHNSFSQKRLNKVNSRKEFFRASISEIRKVVEEQGFNEIHWTLAAEASEYKESLAVDKNAA
ncbi:DUF4041 domain-containing protein [Thalassotalea litorea]|uniref:DUF4041 domain-containing protein n=1 Tax=Thalassotalea litorea TaxID=2020715 RepID=A0A5R9IP72_9GAMM|nr:DUF4041 domain-containing protein [Thalassotalea litorea]TLU67344.1 DUF4041 domain-containing protein [Thalassotalea litorea]